MTLFRKNFRRALAYARQSLYNECEQCTTAGHVHLTVGSVYLELAGFNKALDSFQHAHKIAQTVQDPALELQVGKNVCPCTCARSESIVFLSQVYVGLSELFSRLQDADKSARYAAKAYDLSRSLQLGDLNSRHHRAALLQMASALRKQGELGDAQDYCSVSGHGSGRPGRRRPSLHPLLFCRKRRGWR